MKILITESQYKLLTRRLEDFAMIDREFKYQLRKESPCGWRDFQNYFDWVTYKTEDNVLHLLVVQEGISDTIKPEDWLEFSKKIRSEIQEYIYSNLYEYTEIHYHKYKENNCPEE